MLILAFSVPRQIQRLGFRSLGEYVSRLRKAYLRGRHSREMLSVSYEKLWAQPVSVLSDLLCSPA